MATTSVSARRPRSSRSVSRPERPASSIGPDFVPIRSVRPEWWSQEWLSELATFGQRPGQVLGSGQALLLELLLAGGLVRPEGDQLRVLRQRAADVLQPIA